MPLRKLKGKENEHKYTCKEQIDDKMSIDCYAYWRINRYFIVYISVRKSHRAMNVTRHLEVQI